MSPRNPSVDHPRSRQRERRHRRFSKWYNAEIKSNPSSPRVAALDAKVIQFMSQKQHTTTSRATLRGAVTDVRKLFVDATTRDDTWWKELGLLYVNCLADVALEFEGVHRKNINMLIDCHTAIPSRNTERDEGIYIIHKRLIAHLTQITTNDTCLLQRVMRLIRQTTAYFDTT